MVKVQIEPLAVVGMSGSFVSRDTNKLAPMHNRKSINNSKAAEMRLLHY